MILERLFFTGNQKFFVLFDELAVHIRKMSSLLQTQITGADTLTGQRVHEMEELERTTAELIRTLFMELGRNLITPFDREDIHFLATDLSNITRNLLHCAKQIRNYKIDCSGEVTRFVVKNNDEAIAMLGQILNKLRSIKDLSRQAVICADIRKKVSENGDLLDSTIARLLDEEKDELQLVKMMEHYEALHTLVEKTGEMVNVCESIIIKYS